jgi:hypothetical protein
LKKLEKNDDDEHNKNNGKNIVADIDEKDHIKIKKLK